MSFQFFFASSFALLTTIASAGERRQLIFEDDFNRTESQEIKDEPGNGWSTNSRTRAGGNKQVDLRSGALYIFMHQSADHAVSVRHDAEFRNGSVELRFMLEDARDKLGLNFADLKLKTVHAGHLFKVTVGTKRLEVADLKTGTMALKIRAKRLADKNDAEVRKLLATKKKNFPVNLDAGKWHTLSVEVSGESLRVKINGKAAGSFTSPGFAHPTKRMLRLSVPREAVVDDVKIYAKHEVQSVNKVR